MMMMMMMAMMMMMMIFIGVFDTFQVSLAPGEVVNTPYLGYWQPENGATDTQMGLLRLVFGVSASLTLERGI